MWTILKYVLLSAVGLTLTVGGAAAWYLLVPVTPSNVESRITHMCLLGSAAARVDGWSRKRQGRTPMSYEECGCSGAQITQFLGPSVSATLADATRLHVGHVLWSKMTGGDARAQHRSPYLQHAYMMIVASERGSRACRGSGGSPR